MNQIEIFPSDGRISIYFDLDDQPGLGSDFPSAGITCDRTDITCDSTVVTADQT